MFQFIRRKIKNKKWLNLCLLVGIILLVAVFACHPMFERGAANQLLQTAFENYVEEKKEFPAVITREENYQVEEYKDTQAIYDRMDAYENKWQEYVEADTVSSNQSLMFSGFTARSAFRSNKRFFTVGCIRNMQEHIELVDGSIPQETTTEDGAFYCLISEAVMDDYGLVTGEQLSVTYTLNKEEELHFIISGVIRQSSYSDNYWTEPLEEYQKTIFVSEETMDRLFERSPKASIACSQRLLLNYTQIDCSRASVYREYLEQFIKADGALTINFLDTLKSFEEQHKSASMVLAVLELPCIVLLLLFIYMVSSQILALEEGEIAVLRSRGVTRKQVMNLYLLQSALLSVVGIFVGILLGFVMCRCAASTDGFLKFSAKDISLYQFTWQMFLYGGIACVIAVFFMTFPVFKRARLTIVEQKGLNRYTNKKPFWQKFFLDIVLLGVSVYLFYNYNKQSDEIALRIVDGESVDPMIFLNASLFLFSCGLLFLRLVGYLIAAIDRIGKKRWKPAAYASFLQIRRTFHRQGFLSVFLIMTISSGLFDANMARTMNENNEQRVLYDVGTDFKATDDRWSLQVVKRGDTYYWSYKEPDYEAYTKLEEEGICESVTKVIEDRNVDLSYKKETYRGCELMGIHTKEFGETARLLDGLNDEHWFYALNQLAQNPDAVIISRNIADAFGVSVGDSVNYTRYSPIKSQEDQEIGTVRGKICAVIDAFPGYSRYQYMQDEDGKYYVQEKYLVIANYATVVSRFGLTPYTLWMRLGANASDEQVVEHLTENNIGIGSQSSAAEQVSERRSSAMIQITNGMFTMSFLISILICSVGFLIYWIMSMKNRELLFGIYRAMGMPIKSIYGMLLNEQFFGSILPILAGGGVGALGTLLFVKLLALVYLPKKHNIAIRMFIYGGDIWKLFAVVMLVVIICLFVIWKLLKKMRIAEALKLGED